MSAQQLADRALLNLGRGLKKVATGSSPPPL